MTENHSQNLCAEVLAALSASPAVRRLDVLASAGGPAERGQSGEGGQLAVDGSEAVGGKAAPSFASPRPSITSARFNQAVAQYGDAASWHGIGERFKIHRLARCCGALVLRMLSPAQERLVVFA
jgi:hypothetical protein